MDKPTVRATFDKRGDMVLLGPVTNDGLRTAVRHRITLPAGALLKRRRTRMCKCPECGEATPFGRGEQICQHIVECYVCFRLFNGENIETWLEGDTQ